MVLSLKIKQAEFAFADGRYDEAFELVCEKAVISHRAGQKLANKLGKKLTSRGNEHTETGRTEQGLADCNKAAKLLGNTIEVSELRAKIIEYMERKHHLSRQQAVKIAAAKENIEAGWVSVGEDILGEAESGAGAVLLQNAAAVRSKNEAVIARAEKAIDEGYLEEAIETIKHGRCGKEIGLYSAELVGRIRRDVCKNVRENLNIGRVDLAERTIEMLESIGAGSLESDELKRIVKECRKACGYVASGQLAWAVELFGKLKMALPEAKWLEQSAEDARKGAKAIEALRAGPLGLMGSTYAASKIDKINEKAVPKNNKHKRDEKMTGAIGSKFILQIDGVGSWLVVCGDKVTVGPVSSSSKCDIAVVAAADMPVATIERSEGDYFIQSKYPVGINGNAVTNRLLSNGDKIALSNRCRCKFRKVNSASSTAELVPEGIRFPRADITGVILMDREILIGAGGANHIRTELVKDSVMLYVKDGQMVCKSFGALKTHPTEQPVIIGEQVEVGSMSIMVTTDSM